MEPVLALEEIAVPWARPYDAGLSVASFALGPGELAMALLEASRPLTPLADVASGLLSPEEGRATFKGRDWAQMDADEACAARARTRRVFAAQGWIDRIAVDAFHLSACSKCHTTVIPRFDSRYAVDAVHAPDAPIRVDFKLSGVPFHRISGAPVAIQLLCRRPASPIPSTSDCPLSGGL